MNTAVLTALLDRLLAQPRGYLVFGIEDGTHTVVGTGMPEFSL